MKRFLLLMLIAIACSKQSQPTEKTYPMTATIISCDPAKNTVNLDNKEAPGNMAAIQMDYELRGAMVSSLPPDGTAVEVTMHDRSGSYYITDVKAKKIDVQAFVVGSGQAMNVAQKGAADLIMIPSANENFSRPLTSRSIGNSCGTTS